MPTRFELALEGLSKRVSKLEKRVDELEKLLKKRGRKT